MLPRLSTSLIQLLFDFVEQRGHDPIDLFGEPPPRDTSGLTSAPAEKWLALLARLQHKFPEKALGLAVCSLVAPRHGGLLAYLTQHCHTLGAAFWHLQKYERLVHDLNAGQHRLTPTSLQLRWGSERCRAGQLSDELLMGSMVAYIRTITGQPDLAPRRIVFVAPQPDDITPYEEFFRCPVIFGEPVAIIELSIIDLARPLKHRDVALHDLLERQARTAFDELLTQDQYIRNIQAIIAGLLPMGAATAHHCAQRLQISARTLQRQLALRSWSFQQLLDRTREQLAETLLRAPDTSLVDAALRLGYADQAAFTRAFTRWKGESPGRWRRGLKDLPPLQ